MKRSVFVAALSVLAAGSALAQSNVTVWGRLNTTVERQKVAGVSSTVMNNNASRLGFKGTEDLGGGLKAGFLIEHRFGSDDGTAATPFWAGQSEVNLGSATLGTVRLGRFTSEAYFATADYVSLHNHDTGTSEDKLYYGFFESNNKIGYTSPEIIPGLVAHASLALHGATTNPNARDFAVNYNVGALALGAGYEAAGEDNQFAVRAMYTLGDFTFGGYFQRADDELLGKRNAIRLSGMYAMGSSEFHANVGVAGDWKNVTGDSAAKQFTLGYNYNLSKRTKVYTYYTKVDNKANADYATGVFGGDFSSLAAGIRHNF